MRRLLPTNRYKKSLKLCAKRGCNLRKLENIILALQANGEPPAKSRPHKLVGNRAGWWDCHIEPDWILIYDVNDDMVILHDTGTHSDLFT